MANPIVASTTPPSLNVSNVLKGIKNIKNSKNYISDRKVKSNIEKIVKICNQKYADQSQHGADALNRKVLLDPEIAKLLTPKTLLAVLNPQNIGDSLVELTRFAGGGKKSTTIADVITFGMQDVEAIKFLPNNDENYGPPQYEQQKKAYEKNTRLIIQNIEVAAKRLGVLSAEHYSVKKAEQQGSLLSQFNHIAMTIEAIKNAKRNDDLVKVSGYKAETMRLQAIDGMVEHLAQAVGASCTVDKEPGKTPTINITAPATLNEFAKNFITNPAALLDGHVSHLFYDRAHLVAAIEQDTKIKIGGNTYTFKDVLKEMISQCESNPNAQTAREQFNFRLKQVDMWLTSSEEFMKYHEETRNKIKHEALSPVPLTAEVKEVPFSGKAPTQSRAASSHEESGMNLLFKSLAEMQQNVRHHSTLPFQRKTTHDIGADMIRSLEGIKKSENMQLLFDYIKALSRIEKEVQIHDPQVKIRYMRAVVEQILLPSASGKLGNELAATIGLHDSSVVGVDNERRCVQNFLTNYVTLLTRNDLRSKNQGNNPVQTLLGNISNNPQMRTKENDARVQTIVAPVKSQADMINVNISPESPSVARPVQPKGPVNHPTSPPGPDRVMPSSTSSNPASSPEEEPRIKPPGRHST